MKIRLASSFFFLESFLSLISPAIACTHCNCPPALTALAPESSFWKSRAQASEGLRLLLNARGSETLDAEIRSKLPPLQAGHYSLALPFLSADFEVFFDGPRVILTLENFAPIEPETGVEASYKLVRAKLKNQRILLSFIKNLMIYAQQLVEQSVEPRTQIQVILKLVQLPSESTLEVEGFGRDKRSLYQRMLEDRLGFRKIPGGGESINYYLTIPVSSAPKS